MLEFSTSPFFEIRYKLIINRICNWITCDTIALYTYRPARNISLSKRAWINRAWQTISVCSNNALARWNGDERNFQLVRSWYSSCRYRAAVSCSVETFKLLTIQSHRWGELPLHFS